MWAIEKAAVRAGNQGLFGHGMAVGLGGMVARMALALAVLVAIGVAASPMLSVPPFSPSRRRTLSTTSSVWCGTRRSRTPTLGPT